MTAEAPSASQGAGRAAPELTPPELRGPARPQMITPPLAPGQFRRTSTVDILRPEGLDGPKIYDARARDVVAADAGLVTLDAVHVEGATDDGGMALRLNIAGVDVPQLTGVRVGPGFRKKAAALFPEARRTGAALWDLLDDLPAVPMISSYVQLHAGYQPRWVTEGRPSQADVCAGWGAEGNLIQESLRRGRQIFTPGPLAPSLARADQADAWHDVARLPRDGARRRRRLDVTIGRAILVDAMFRDAVATGEDGEDLVVHEYSLSARIEPDSLKIIELDVDPRVLPYTECPAAAASAQRVVGRRLTDLRELVRAEFAGVSTCTHLNDFLRSLEDVPGLIRARE
jgi:hypothetical protein